MMREGFLALSGWKYNIHRQEQQPYRCDVFWGATESWHA